MLAGQLGNLERRAHAVGAGNPQRLGHVLGRRYAEQAAETAYVADNLLAIRGVHRLLDGVDGARALGGVHACCLVRNFLLRHWMLLI